MAKRTSDELTADLEVESSIKAKRVRRTQNEGHAPDCNDPECEGCDVGDIEITFVRTDESGQEQSVQPSAHELFAMAMEEATNTQAEDQDSSMARRLFDLALEKFQKEEPEDRLGYALCLVSLGKTIEVEESLREGLDILRHEARKDGSLSFHLARAAWALATFIRKRQNEWFEKMKEELESDEEDGVEYEELLKRQQLSREEERLYKESLDAMQKAFRTLVSTKELSKEARAALHDSYGYAQLLDQSFHEKHVYNIIDSVIRHIQSSAYEDDADLKTLWGGCLFHKAKFIVDASDQLAVLKECEKHLEDAMAVYRKHNNSESPWAWELYAMVLLNQTNAMDDEDDIVETYDKAVESFKTASKLNPDNKDLNNMLNMLLSEPGEAEGETAQ